MAVPIEGFSVVVQRARIQHLLESESIGIPNATALGDDDIWRCCFMAEADAEQFIEALEQLGLNASQGPDSDVVLVSEFDCSLNPYCEWLATARWEKAVIGWKAGTNPKSVVAREGWDPKVGSGLVFHDRSSQANLEFLRLQGNVEVHLNKETGEEVYLGRTFTPVAALFETAARVIGEHLRTAGEKPLSGADAVKVAEAVKMLEKALAESPDWWNALWYHGKGQIALGNYEAAYESLRRAFELQKEAEPVPRELAGVCLELGKFAEAVRVAECGATLEPQNAGTIGNVAVAYLLAGRLEEAKKTVAAALKIDQSDKINQYLQQIITDVAEGRRPQPDSFASLSSPPRKRAKRFWEFWKK